MGSQVKIGDRIFNAIGKGRLQQDQIAQRQVRWSTQFSGPVALTAINGSASLAANLPVVVGSGLINLKNIICIAIFNDGSSGANYVVSEAVNLYVYPEQFSNVDRFDASSVVRLPYQAGGIDYQIMLNTSTDLAIDCFVYGGDIAARTGITPAVTDTVSFYLSAIYEPL